MTYSIFHILFSPDLLDFFLFAFSLFIFFSFGEFSREVAFSSRKSGILHFPDMIRPMFREKISLAPSASFLFSYFLFSIFLISAALTSLRSLSSEISGKIHENLKKLPSKYGTPFNAHFSRDFPPGSGAINHRRTNRCSDQVYRANVRGAARVCRPRRLFPNPLFRERWRPPPAKSKGAPKRRTGPHYTPA